MNERCAVGLEPLDEAVQVAISGGDAKSLWHAMKVAVDMIGSALPWLHVEVDYTAAVICTFPVR